IVCVKQVPDPETPATAFRVDEAAMKAIPAQGIAPVISPYDVQAVEAALRIKDATGEGKVTILSIGQASARDVIKHALAMGSDEGVLVDDPALYDNYDPFVTAQVLTAAIQKIGDYNLILCGRAAADWDYGIAPSGIAELLNLPCVTVARKVEAKNGTIAVDKVLADGFETVDVQAPCVITISNEFGDPRYPQLRQIMAAARKQVDVWTLTDLGLSADGLNHRITMEKLYVPVKQSNVEIIEGDTAEEQAAALARKLREAKLI
ncbi:MAG: electron transfer flavoprotein subunit beta/FixA family protein, partial [Dehalococcoidia bacterium]